ncbi:MAG: DUF4249 domain-containing protein [Salinivirgaceae bacterium]|nr:DUF4249 domain-containing protein [Salinivirgaceae bacterium]
MSRFRKNILLPIVAFATAFTTGCYEPSDFAEFGQSEPIIVIEGRITNLDSVATVVVSRSVSATDSADCEFVDDALVIVRDNRGNSYTLDNAGPGLYQTANMRGVIGDSYLLTVEADGNNYSSVERMPPSAFVDSIVVEYRNSYTIFDTIGYYLSVYSRRNSDSVQLYRIEVEKNGKLLNDGLSLWLYEDSHLSESYQMTIPYPFESGDVLEVSVYSLSPTVYEYFSGLSNQFSSKYSNIQPPLTNPKSNIRPSALGCFQASSVVRARFRIGGAQRSVVVP